MKRQPQAVVILDNRPITYSVVEREGEKYLFIRFRDAAGRRLEKSTKVTSQKAVKEVAPSIIAKVYQGEERTESMTWEQAIEKMTEAMTAHNLRQRTLDDYLQMIDNLRKVVPGSKGPFDITETTVKGFKIKRMGQVVPITVAGNIRKLSAIWSKWFIDELGILKTNPWEEVEPPKVDKKKKRILNDGEDVKFCTWLSKRWNGWTLPLLFVNTKAAIGCRVTELASMESSQLREGRIWFEADETKGREERPCKIPADLYKSLEAIKGDTWLWEAYTDGLRQVFLARGGRSRRHALNVKDEFVPRRLVRFMQDELDTFREAHPDIKHFTLHNLRGTAMTKALVATNGAFDRCSIAFDCHPDTMKEYYVDFDKGRIADDVFDLIQK